MKIQENIIALSIAAVLTAPTTVLAGDYYATVQVGASQQASDSTPYGNNVATDADFPAEFDAGDGAVGGIGIGYKFNKNIRLEGRLAYRDGDFNERQLGVGERAGEEYVLNGDLKTSTITVEGFYDFPNNSPITPFVKVGLGVSDNSYSARLGGAGVAGFDGFDGVVDGFYDNYADGDSTEFSWNIGFGASYKLSESIAVYGEYQYAEFGDVSTGQDSFTDGFEIDGISAHEGTVGLRVNF